MNVDMWSVVPLQQTTNAAELSYSVRIGIVTSTVQHGVQYRTSYAAVSAESGATNLA